MGMKYYYFISLASAYHGKSSSSPPDLTNNSIMVGLCNIFKAEFAKNVPVETEISNIHLGRRQRLNPVLVVGSPVGQPLHCCVGLLKSRASPQGGNLIHSPNTVAISIFAVSTESSFKFLRKTTSILAAVSSIEQLLSVSIALSRSSHSLMTLVLSSSPPVSSLLPLMTTTLSWTRYSPKPKSVVGSRLRKARKRQILKTKKPESGEPKNESIQQNNRIGLQLLGN